MSDSTSESSSLARQARFGLWLFSIYFVAYAIFMGWAAFYPLSLGEQTSLGPNIAIVYGFGLILGAFVIAVIYMVGSRVERSNVEAETTARSRHV